MQIHFTNEFFHKLWLGIHTSYIKKKKEKRKKSNFFDFIFSRYMIGSRSLSGCRIHCWSSNNMLAIWFIYKLYSCLDCIIHIMPPNSLMTMLWNAQLKMSVDLFYTYTIEYSVNAIGDVKKPQSSLKFILC